VGFVRAINRGRSAHDAEFISIQACAIDSNYSIIFSFWDQIGGALRIRKDGRPVDFGLDGYGGEQWQGVRELLTTPF
jgi:hypothetical protein